ncbi:hypothetical protein HKX48_004018 [Thoreauomyces humboldtii]|nr:hypothetical protein HKX48_004018 [Thoreauomyces humboldtii]
MLNPTLTTPSSTISFRLSKITTIPSQQVNRLPRTTSDPGTHVTALPLQSSPNHAERRVEEETNASLRQSVFREFQSVIQTENGGEYIIGTEYDEFATLWRENRGGDPFKENGVLERCCAYCINKAEELREIQTVDPGVFTNAMNTELHWWTLEANTWKLVKSLVGLRTHPQPEPEIPEKDLIQLSDAMLNEKLQNRESRETLAVRAWLEDTARPFQPVEIRPGYWPHTVKHVGRVGSADAPGNIVRTVDPDAPIREGRNLHPNDAEYEANMHRTVYEYVRRGCVGDAVDLYVACDQQWRAAGLRGNVLANDPASEGGGLKVGNANRGLWKHVAFKAASKIGIDPYERAVLAVFVGDAANALPVCTSWEDQLWVRYCALHEALIDRNLASVPLLYDRNDDFLELEVPPDALPPAAIFESLEKNENVYIKRAAHEAFHVTQKNIVLDTIGSFITHVKSQLLPGDSTSSSKSITSPHFLRFMTHFVLILKELPISIPVDEADLIVEEYVKLLTNARKNHVIAFYASHLPNGVQVERYATFLQDVLGDDDVIDYLQLAKTYGLDSLAIARRTVQMVFQSGVLQMDVRDTPARDLLIAQVNAVPTPLEDRQICALGLLLTYPTLHGDALWCANMLMRRFLAVGRVNSALAVRKYLQQALQAENYLDVLVHSDWLTASLVDKTATSRDHDNGDNEMGDAMTEHMQYMAFLDAMKIQADWLSLWYRRPGSIGVGMDGSTSVEYREWVLDLKAITKNATEAFESLLDGTWLLPEIDEDADAMEADDNEDILCEKQLLRDIYVPQMVLFLHQIYRETQDIIIGNADKATTLAERAQSEEHLVDHFTKADRMDEFLAMVNQSVNALV